MLNSSYNLLDFCYRNGTAVVNNALAWVSPFGASVPDVVKATTHTVSTAATTALTTDPLVPETCDALVSAATDTASESSAIASAMYDPSQNSSLFSSVLSPIFSQVTQGFSWLVSSLNNSSFGEYVSENTSYSPVAVAAVATAGALLTGFALYKFYGCISPKRIEPRIEELPDDEAEVEAPNAADVDAELEEREVGDADRENVAAEPAQEKPAEAEKTADKKSQQHRCCLFRPTVNRVGEELSVTLVAEAEEILAGYKNGQTKTHTHAATGITYTGKRQGNSLTFSIPAEQDGFKTNSGMSLEEAKHTALLSMMLTLFNKSKTGTIKISGANPVSVALAQLIATKLNALTHSDRSVKVIGPELNANIKAKADEVLARIEQKVSLVKLLEKEFTFKEPSWNDFQAVPAA